MTYFFCLVALLFAAAPANSQPIAAVAPSERPPVVDGVVSADEWRDAVTFSGLQWGGNLDPRRGWVAVALDRTTLYVGFRTELPPDGKLRTACRRRGGQVISDDCVELWIAPPKDGRASGAREFGYFQVLVNAAGTIADTHWERGYGLAPAPWNVRLDVASRKHEGLWEAELAIPLRDLGIETLGMPSVWRLNAVRNWKDPWVQANLTPSSSFSNVGAMLELHIEPEAPTVQVQSLGALTSGRPEIVVRAVRSRWTGGLQLNADLRAGEQVVLEGNRDLLATGQAENTVTLTPTFEPAGKNVLTLSVTDKAGRTWYRRQFSFGPEPEHRWTQREEYVTFHLSFDDGTLTPEQAKGETEPISIKGEPAFTDGVLGKALLVNKGCQVHYSNVDNLPLPCAVSFWVQPRRDRVVGKPPQPWQSTYFWMTRFKQSGYIGVQDSVYGQMLLWLHYFPDLKGPVNLSGPFPWQRDRWYHIAFNLTAKKAELYLDGMRLAGTDFPRPLRADELAPFVVGGGHEYALDDLRIYSRPLLAAEIAEIAVGEKVMDGKIAFFPSLPALVLDAVADAEEIGKAPLRLRLADPSESRMLLDVEVPSEEWQRTQAGTCRISSRFDLPRLAEGTYKAWLEAAASDTGAPRRMLQRVVTVEHYPWEGCKLGTSDALIPPFTPLEVDGVTVSCILRRHVLGGLGLWEQVESLKEPLLARPIGVHAISGGKTDDWTHGAVTFTESKPHRVAFEASSTGPSVSVQSTGEFDYDGLMQVKLRIEPRTDQPLDRLYVDIPVRREMASLFHASGEHIRSNPAGFVPAGEGVVWGSRSLPQPSLENFIGYLWVGGAERGICWAADWDKDWVHSDTRSAIELVRSDDAVTIRVNLINGPVVFTRPREISFALMASPVKPMRSDWRQWALDGPYPGSGKFTILWAGEWACHHGTATRYPLDRDFTFIDKLMDTRRTGETDKAFINDWVKQVMAHPGSLSSRTSEEYLRRHVVHGFAVAKMMHNHGAGSKLVPYSCASCGFGQLPEAPVYGDEWGFRSQRQNCSPSFVDYAVYWADKMMDRGMDGIYVDNTFLTAKYSWPTGDGYVDEDGDVRPGLGLLSRVRHLTRRLAVMMYEQGREPFVYVHMTNANMLPMLSFAQANLAWEFKYGSNDYQERFTPEYMRTVCIGRQAGTIPTLLGGIVGVDPASDEYIRLTRTGLAMALPHETFFYARAHGQTCRKVREILGDFRTGDVEAYPYWENQPLIESAPEQLLVTAYRKSGSVLLVAGNQGDAGAFRIVLTPNALPGQALKAVNRETDEPLDVTDRVVQLVLPTHDFALVEVRTKAP